MIEVVFHTKPLLQYTYAYTPCFYKFIIKDLWETSGCMMGIVLSGCEFALYAYGIKNQFSLSRALSAW